MFLNKTLKTRNDLVITTQKLFHEGLIIPDSYLLDVDQILENAKLLKELADKNNIELFFMLKQIGRNPYIAKKLVELGYAGAVVVDYKEALVMIEHGIKIGNVGHLVQIPSHLLEKIVLAKPEFITVFSFEIMNQIEKICKKYNLIQKVYLKIIDLDHDIVYEGQYGGFELKNLPLYIDNFVKYEHLDITGLTAFPCILENDEHEFYATNNVDTMLKAKDIMEEKGFVITSLNMPSANASYSLELLSKLGCTHAEPGHALTGTTPYHNNISEGEKIAMLYVSEISHSLDGISYFYGGGNYRRGNIANCYINGEVNSVISPDDSSIDYYFATQGIYNYGELVLMNFRTQIFVTRSNVLLIEGIKSNKITVVGEYDAFGKKL